MSLHLEGQTAIVTGGMRGIGLAIARRLHAEAASIVIWDLAVDGWDTTAAGFEPAMRQAVDVASQSSVETPLVAEMTQAHIEASKANIPMGRFLKAEEIANMVTWIAGPECSFTTGFVFDLSGGRATY